MTMAMMLRTIGIQIERKDRTADIGFLREVVDGTVWGDNDLNHLTGNLEKKGKGDGRRF